MQHHSKHRRWILSFVVAVVALAVATPVLAQYIGPKRTVDETYTVCKINLNECQYVQSKGEWKYKNTNSWSCSLESKPWQSYSNKSRPCNSSNKGYEYWSREEHTKTQTVTYPPATISSSLTNCTLQNGWCITVPQLSIQGIEPVAGHRITAIEGTLNGQNFACMNSSCNVPLKEGENDFTFWALSTFLDSSEMGAFSAKVDSQLPTITGALSGPQGRNGWYLGPVTFNGSAADAASGVDKFICRRDGILLTDCNTIPVDSDGPHDLLLVARDFVGHTRGIRVEVSIDSKDPTLAASINGTLGSNSWYTAAILNASTTDPVPGSGIFGFIYNLDGIRWVRFPASGTLDLPDGKHTVEIRAVDNAGRNVSSSTSFWLDSVAPSVNLDSAGTFGSNNWYITIPTLTASASDDTSGLAILEYSLDNSDWAAYTTPLNLSEGIHSVSIWAQDQAGSVTQVDRAYQVDTRPPQIAGSLSGTPGMNGWYISQVTISASASDPLPGSDIDTFTYTLNGATETPYTSPVILADGQHTVQLHANDKAGLSASIEQTFKVDTIPPTVTIDSTIPNWVKGIVNLNGTVGDNGSGLSSAELSLDGGQTWQPITASWNAVWDTTSSPNGVTAIRLRAVDQAGLTAEQTVDVGVDYQPPAINLPDLWFQWDTVTLDISDEHSGLSETRIEISDPQGRWPARVIQLDPAQFPLQFKWDRRFGDGTIAEAGTYDVKVFATDRVGNTADNTTSIRVLLEILPPGPTSTQPSVPPTAVNSATPVLSVTATPVWTATVTKPASSKAPANTATPVILVFGTIQPPAQATSTATSAATPTPRVTPTQSNVVSWMQSVFAPVPTQESVTEITSTVGSKVESNPRTASTNNSVLWGTAATAAITALTAYMQEEKRKREEEKARLEALEEAKEERRKKMKERKTAKMEAKRAQEAAWEAARQEAWAPAHIDVKVGRMEYEEGLNSVKAAPPATTPARSSLLAQERRAEGKEEIIQEEINSYTAKPQEWKTDYENYVAQQALLAKQKEQEAAAPQPKKKTWWQKAIDWVDNHQVEIALGIGVVTGAAVVILTAGLALPLVAAGALVASAAVTAGVTVGAGTIALNKYYERPWNENLLRNALYAGVAAAAVSTVGFLCQAAIPGIGAYCAKNPSTCARVEPVLNAIDKVEEVWLNTKLGYQNWSGNTAGAAETAFELQTEYIDGGMPGNSVAKEVGELSSEALSAIAKYGDDVIPLIAKHGDEALEIIQKYGDDGIALLQKYGDEAANLIGSYGDYAVEVMQAVNPAQAKKLLQSLDDDVLDYALEQGPDAVDALSRWSPKDLRLYGPQLALRAQKDADALAAVKKLKSLGPIDPKNLTKEQKALIDTIAANSTQYAEEGQVVLGKWVDFGSGFVESAQNTGSIHYNPHPDMWNMLGGLGKENQEEVAWLINKQVVQTGIGKGKPFEYTLNGIPTKNIIDEGNAVEAIFAGATDSEIIDILQAKSMPIRMKELKELKQAGYQYVFDEATNSYILTLP